MTTITRAELEVWDVKDPLAAHRQDYILPKGVIYLDGNSLGPLPVQTKERLRKTLEEEWGEGLIRSWNDADWVGAPTRVGDKVAELIGAEAGEVIVSDSTSVNLFKLAGSLLPSEGPRRKIICEKGNFPTDQYIVQSLKSLDNGVIIKELPREEILDAVDEETLALVLTHVHYKTGEIFDMEMFSRRTHEKGALVLWDLCHSAGAMPLALNTCNVDMAVGCGYKYLNGGPGAPAFSFIAKRHQAKRRQPIGGWFGHQDPFAFTETYEPAQNIKQHLVGTPGILGLAALESGVDLLLKLDMTKVRQKSLKLVGLFQELVGEFGNGFGLTALYPLPPEDCGNQTAFCHDSGYQIMRALIKKGVIGDFREPNIMRFGFGAPYTRYTDVWDAANILNAVLTTEEWKRPEFSQRHSVT